MINAIAARYKTTTLSYPMSHFRRQERSDSKFGPWRFDESESASDQGYIQRSSLIDRIFDKNRSMSEGERGETCCSHGEER